MMEFVLYFLTRLNEVPKLLETVSKRLMLCLSRWKQYLKG
jgi:hypothetical protein